MTIARKEMPETYTRSTQGVVTNLFGRDPKLKRVYPVFFVPRNTKNARTRQSTEVENIDDAIQKLCF